MRLTVSEIEMIRALTEERFGAYSRIWLFGSRLDDDARGGDIDLYIEPGRHPTGNLFLDSQALRRDLQGRLRTPVDLVVNPGQTSAFMRQAREEGQRL